MKTTWTAASLSALIAVASAAPTGNTQMWSNLRKNVRENATSTITMTFRSLYLPTDQARYLSDP